jgi:polar amino acid transport system permease protein
VRELAELYVETFRGTPLLVQIYIFYFCIAAAVRFDNAVIIGIITLAFFSGAYISEMVRAGIESIDKGQIEAAKSTGLDYWQTMRHVIFPQALRRIIPPVTGQFVSLIKDSSLLSVISVRELTKASEVINATTYKTFEAYLPLAVLYLLLTYPLSQLTQRLERKLRYD